MKIDVKGAGLGVFRGAAQTLQAKHPAILFEAAGPNWEEISSMLRNLGCVLYETGLAADERRPSTRPVSNTLAAPA